MRHFYYSHICKDPLKRLRYFYRRLQKDETRLLQIYLVLEAKLLTGDERYMEIMGPVKRTIEETQLLIKGYKSVLEKHGQ